MAARWVTVGDINPGAEPDFHQFIELQRDDGLAHRGPRHLEGLRELALRGQPLSHFVDAVGYCLCQLLSDLFIEAPWFGHGTQVSASAAPAQVNWPNRCMASPWPVVPIGQGGCCVWPDQLLVSRHRAGGRQRACAIPTVSRVQTKGGAD